MIDLKEKTEGFRGLRSGISEVTIIDFGVRVKNDRKIAEWVIGLSRNQRSYNPEMGGRNAPKYASNQAYAEGGIQSAQSLLQSTKETLNRNYLNGHPLLNKLILSQGLEVIENLDNETSIEQAKGVVVKRRGIPILTHDEGERMRAKGAKPNPNGLVCDGQQAISDGKNTQRETNYAIGINLPCAEFDMCHKCQSAKAIDEVEAIYKLISYIDVLKESLDMYPDTKGDIHEKIEHYEYTLDGASYDVFDGAMERFNTQGRHPRVSLDHAPLSLYGWRLK